jgi:3-oxoadipate enol-lactonase
VPNVRGVDIAIRDQGEGLPLFWGHGLVSSMEEEDRFMVMDFARLARRHRVIRWDARGHGLSGGAPVPDDYRWNNLGRDLIALADEVGVDQFVAGGVSMGAATALHAAIQVPRRVLGLVLMLPPTAYETREEQADLYRAGAVLIERLGLESYLEQLRNLPAPEILADFGDRFTPEPRVSEALMPSVLRGAATSDLPAENAVRAVTAPALLLPWVGDPGHPMSTSERLLEIFSDVQIHVAHHLRDVRTWTDRIDSFLEARTPEPSTAS